MSGRLILCSTPIGNLGDVSSRLADTLAGADLIYAEDTRRTATLIRHLGITVPMRSYFAGNEAGRSTELAEKLRSGATIALVTDAGTPAISDPGVSAVRAARSVAADVTVVPGPSAVTASLAASGLSGDRFVFEGFLPKKTGERRRRLEALATEERTIVLFSPTVRVGVDLGDLASHLGESRRVVVCRELTKVHEEIVESSLAEAAAQWRATGAKGEFTIVIAGAEPAVEDIGAALIAVRASIAGGASLSAAVREVATAHNVSRRRLYEAALEAETKESPG